ncbi:hypothetical protein ACA910_020909 [Epithemia clementina (nom. ined.)]
MGSLDGDASTKKLDVSVPKFAFREITLGTLVGQGGFSDVREIISVELDRSNDSSEEENSRREKFAKRVNERGTKKYVLKTLRRDLHEQELAKGVLDLAIEADMLGTLKHGNIISLRAVANSDPHERRFFVVLDRLSVTLERKFNLWRKIADQSAGIYFPCYGYCSANAPVLHNLWKERLEVSIQIAQAIEYLHAKGIVYRDLKPDNIGFDENGVVKLFDFGLAKRLQDSEKVPDNGHPAFSGLYHLTGNTGSLRYMAPEVARCLPYDQSVDAYSFGILFWQICSLTTPYAKYSLKMHAERIVRQGHRPKQDSTWPPTWVQLQQSCWSSDRAYRPPFSQILQTLRDQVDLMEDGVVPSRASEIRAKNKRKRIVSNQLDIDTRKSSAPNEVQKRYETEVV